MSERSWDYCVIDAFTRTRGQGNPAAVVLDARGLSDEEMARIAAEINLSETTFVLPGRTGADLTFRWFTPRCEVRMCGHATLAGVHGLLTAGMLPQALIDGAEGIRIATAGGELRAFVERDPEDESARAACWLDLIDPVLTPERLDIRRWESLLGLGSGQLVDRPPPVRSQDGDLLLFVGEVVALNGASPDFRALAGECRRIGIRGVCLATLGTLSPTIAVQSRFFAPAAGIDEDPVTGSVHGPLAAHLVLGELVPVSEGLAALTCVQSSPAGRAGLVRVLAQRQAPDRCAVRIGGNCVTFARGRLWL